MTKANTIFVEDGLFHYISEPFPYVQYKDDPVYLDWHYANNPGTVFEIVKGGSFGGGLDTYNTSSIHLNGGTIGYSLIGWDNSTITISGGSIGTYLALEENCIAKIKGGSIGGMITVDTVNPVYIYGTDFSVDGQTLEYGDSLLNYGTMQGIYRVVTLTGTLQDGSILNNKFNLWEEQGANVIVIPEPTTLLLLVLGGLILRKRK